MSAVFAAGTNVRVELTGAFHAGVTVLPEHHDYEAFQAKLLAHLSTSSGGWAMGGRGSGDADLGRYDNRGEGTLMTPLQVVIRSGEELVAEVREAVRGVGSAEAALVGLDGVIRCDVSGARVGFGESGIATLRVQLHVRLLKELKVSELRQQVGMVVGRLAQPFGSVSRTLASSFVAAATSVGGGRTERPWWLLGTLDEDEYDGMSGRLLWLHPVFVIRAVDEDLDQLGYEATGLLTSTWTRVRFGDTLLMPGIGTSALVHAGNQEAVSRLLDVVDLGFAHYALTAELDRALSVRLRELQQDHARSAHAYEEEATGIAQMLDRVALHRAELDTVLIGFGGGTIEVWEGVNRVQRQDHLDLAVDRKLGALSTAYRVRIDTAAARRQRRLDLFAFVFASLTVATTVIVGADFLTAGPVVTPPLVRLGVLIASILLLAALLLVYSRQQRPPRPPRRKKGAR